MMRVLTNVCGNRACHFTVSQTCASLIHSTRALSLRVAACSSLLPFIVPNYPIQNLATNCSSKNYHQHNYTAQAPKLAKMSHDAITKIKKYMHLS